MIGIHTIEDCLEVLAGLQKHNLDFKIESSDATIMYSIARQVFKGTALTDRQYNLMKEKLQNYKPQFEQQDVIGFDRAVDKLRQPLRHIDRSKYIKIVDYPSDMPYEADDSGKFIAVRFPFKKSDIVLINEISHRDGYFHKKGSHVHYFIFNETTLLDIGNRFFNKDFVIDDVLKEKYEQIKQIEKNKNEYLPNIVDNDIINISQKLREIIQKETNNDFLKIYDRRFRYCLDHINIDITPDTLEESIAKRDSIEYHSKPSVHSIDKVLHALYNLDRFPMLVVVEGKNAESQLHEVVNFFRDLISTEEQSVLFRDEESDSGVNQLIKHRKINNWVDKDTKIVYINNNKLPKVLLEAEWKPTCTFAYNSNNNKNVQMYIKNNCDLIVYREETVSPFLRMYR